MSPSVRLGFSAVLAVAIGCSGKSDTASPADASVVEVEQPANGESIDLPAVIKRVRHAFRVQGDRFVGGDGTYGSEVETTGAFTVKPRVGAERATRFETVSIGRGSAATSGSARSDLGFIAVDRGVAVEHLANEDHGVEQSWHLASMPTGDGDLVVEVAVSGNAFVGATGAGLHFADASRAGVRYGVATFVDAKGKETRIAPSFREGRIVLRVPAAVIESAAYPAVLDPTIGPELAVDTPVEIAASGGGASVAFDGTNYLVVWNGNGVRAARVSKTGAVLDAFGFAVTSEGFRPSVAWDGTEFVVTSTQNIGSTNSLFARRVSSAGVVLDASDVKIADDADNSQIACDGTNCLVVWQRGSLGPSFFARINKTLAIVGAAETSAAATGSTPSVAYDGTNYLVVYADSRADSDIYGSRISKAGVNLDPTGFAINTSTDYQSTPSVGFDGTKYLVAWRDHRSGSTFDIYATRVSPAKAILDGTGTLVGPDIGYATTVAVTGAGGGFIVEYESDNSPAAMYAYDTYVAAVSAAGVASPPSKILGNGGYFTSGAIAFDGTNALALSSSAAGKRVSKAGVALDASPIKIVRAANAEQYTTVAFDGTNYLVAWEDRRGADSDIYAARIAKSGAVLDSSGIAVTTAANSQTGARVAFDGTNFLVAWTDARNPPGPPFSSDADVYGRFISKSGVPGAEVQLAGGPDILNLGGLAFDGTNYVVVYNRQTASGSGDGVYARRVTTAGAILDSAGILVLAPLAGGYASGLAIACDGTNCMLGLARSNGSSNAIGLKRMSKAGVVLDTSLIDPGSTGARRDGLQLAYNGKHYLAAWSDYRNDSGDNSNPDIYAARVSTAGVVLDPTPLALCKAALDQSAPVVVDPGDNVGTAVFWYDGRSAAPGSYSGDIYGTFVKYDGTVLDPGGIVVAASASPENAPSAASEGSGKMLVAYHRYDPLAPFAAYRARVRLVSSGIVPGGTCATGADCATRVCADGVCCDTACTGTCQSCTVTPGTCKAVPSGGTDSTCAGTCDGAGGCKKSTGSSCSVASECASAQCVDGTCCDTACSGGCDVCNAAGSIGTCSAIAKGGVGAPSCSPYLCGGSAACPSTCADDVDCASGFYCTPAKICQAQKDNAQACNLATDCAVSGCRECKSGNCVDGVCCNTACSGACDTCAGVTKGACSLFGRGAAGAPSCAPYTCGGSSAVCATTCASDLDCATSAYCRSSDSTCQSKSPLGGVCSSKVECSSGNCVDGVCCDTACDGTCVACSAAAKTSGADGTCGPAADGKDPHGSCADDGMATCKRDGLCNGSGGCRSYSAGTSCGASLCEGSVAKGLLCDGLGECKSSSGVDCMAYACAGGGCKSTCSTNADCSASAWCDDGSCKPKSANGGACKTADACSSNFCVDAVCCASACSGQCEACDVAGAEGACTPVTGDAHGTRTKCAKDSGDVCASSLCDGTTRDTCAAKEPTTTACRPPSCADGVATFVSKCDGKGACPSSETRPCEPYACDATACKSSCAEDTDCAKTARCDKPTGKCVSAATCDDHIVTGADGTTTDCAPFRCESSGRCKESCASSSDCVAPSLCDGSGKCVQAPTDDADSGCGCRVTGASTDRGWLAALVLAALVARRRLTMKK